MLSALIYALAGYARFAWDALAPRCCGACATPLATTEELFCSACEATLVKPFTSSVDSIPLVALGAYSGALAQAVRNLKYAGRSDLGAALGRRLRQAAIAQGILSEPVALVPVPLHPARLAARGFNQSALLAKGMIGGAIQLAPLGLLRRTRATAQQARLSRDDRLLNLRHSITCHPKVVVTSVVLVDDVYTTGATVAECARALASAQLTVRGICVAALAQPAPTVAAIRSKSGT